MGRQTDFQPSCQIQTSGWFSLLEDGIIFQFPKLNLFNIYIILLFKKYKHVRRIIASFQFSIITILSHSSPPAPPWDLMGENKRKLSLVRWLFFLWNISVPFSIHCSQWWPQSPSVPGKPIFALQVAPVLPETFFTWVTNLILLVP